MPPRADARTGAGSPCAAGCAAAGASRDSCASAHARTTRAVIVSGGRGAGTDEPDGPDDAELQEFAPEIPPDRLLVETDSPFLAPVPHRGHTCEPAYVADTARFVAGLRGESLDELADNTTRNFRGLFSKAYA